MDPAKRRRSGENDHVAWLQAVHCFAISVKADELLVLGHAQFFVATIFFVERVVTSLEFGIEYVGHGDELDRTTLGRQGIGRRAGAAAAAADQGHLN